MKPTIAVDITARDKSGGGFKAAERSAAGFARKATAIQDSGVSKITQAASALTRIRDGAGAADLAGRGISNIGRVSIGAAENVARLGAGLTGMGGMATRAFGTVAAGAGLAVTSIGAMIAVLGAAGVAAYKLGEKWAKTGSEVGRTARDLGISNADLQARRAAGERYGVTPEGTDAAVGGLADTLYEAKAGGNNLALGVLGQIGVKLKTGANGQTDVGAAYDDIADAIARQKDPAVQRKLAGIFGMSSALPALRQGSGVLKAAGADYLGSGSAYSDAEIGEASETSRKATRLEQHLRKLEKAAGGAAARVTSEASDRGVTLLRDGGLASTGVALAEGGRAASASLVDGARRAGLAFGAALNSSALTAAAGGGPGGRSAGDFMAFRDRIRWQESRNRQFGSDGKPLTSRAGAVGVMQVLPETGRRAAARAGIPWDEKKFRNDKAYNEQIGTAELLRLYKKYNGNEVLAAAAYNAGEGRLDGIPARKGKRPYVGWLERFGDPRKGETSDAEFASRIPFDETRNYAAKTARPGGDKTQVEITLKGAPAGTTSRVAGGKNTEVSMNVVRSLEGPGGLR